MYLARNWREQIGIVLDWKTCDRDLDVPNDNNNVNRRLPENSIAFQLANAHAHDMHKPARDARFMPGVSA